MPEPTASIADRLTGAMHSGSLLSLIPGTPDGQLLPEDEMRR